MLEYQKNQKKIPLANIQADEVYAYLDGNRYLFIKRSIDVILSILLIVFLFIPIIILAAVIRIETKGNPIFYQKRVGQNGRPFTLYKLRTMRSNKEKSAATFAEINDDRITKFGKFLRRTRIDETPQLINVLIGQMSLIGPRPEQLHLMPYISKQIPQFELREVLRPGITGWAQVNQGYADDIESSRTKLEFDIFYIQNISLTFDLKILVLTVGTLIRGHGAR